MLVLGASQSTVCQYNTSSYDKPMIGYVDPLMGITGNSITKTGGGFGKTQGKIIEEINIGEWK